MDYPKIGVFGSAFNPPTLGHLDVLKQASSEFDLILLVPSVSHAFTKKMLPFDVRIELLEIFAANVYIPECKLEVCKLEVDMLQQFPNKPVYTYDLLEALEEHYKGKAQLGFIRGPDNADPQTWQRFYKAEEIGQRWTLFTAEERVQVRSTLIRERIQTLSASGKEDDKLLEALDSLLMPCVRDYILANKLYES